LAEPFIPFWPGSTTRPLLSAAISYSMQLEEEEVPASRVALILVLREGGDVLGSFAEKLSLYVNTTRADDKGP
jgi:hypothetical protein